MQWMGRAGALFAVLTLTAPAMAQTNDRGLYRSWAIGPLQGGPRWAGFGGAFAAVADDSSAVVSNPAGIAELPKTEIAGSVAGRGAATVGPGDRVASATRLGLISGAGTLTSKWAIGGYISQPSFRKTSISGDVVLPGGERDMGALDATVTDAGVAAAWRPVSSVAIGVRVTGTHLKLEGASRTTVADGQTTLEVGTAAGDTRFSTALGVLVRRGRFQAALVGETGVTWTANRTANNPALGVNLDPGSNYDVRSPSRFAAGVSVRATPRLLVVGQVDYVRYGEVQDRLSIRSGTANRADYVLDDGFEPRAGIEYSWPLGGLSLQLRAGIHSRAANMLRYSGSDPSEAAAFTGASRSTMGAFGASVVLQSGLALDAAATFGGERSGFVAGGRIRF